MTDQPKCPHCGRYLSGERIETKKYEYTGSLREYVPQIVALHAKGVSLAGIEREIRKSGARTKIESRGYLRLYGPQILTGTISYILKRMGLTEPESAFSDREWKEAHDDHAALLRLENLTFVQIGARLGVGQERARQRVLSAERRWRRATRRCRTTITAE